MYGLIPIPESVRWQWQRDEIERNRARIQGGEDAFTDAKGIRRWRCNKAVIPVHVFNEAFLECPHSQADAAYEETQAFIKAYKKRPQMDSEENRYEMEAAFGPGVKVVDVISGRRVR